MAQKTMLAERIDTAGANAGLDAACKRVVANKLVLAWIMKHTMREYSITENCKAGNVQEQAENYDLLSAVMICLGEASEEAESQKVIDLLNILLASEMDVKEKKKHLEQDFGIKMTKQLEEETGKMCNYSEYIEERGVEKGIEKGIAALINTCRTLGATWDMTLKQLREQFEISEDKAEEKMQQYWKK